MIVEDESDVRAFLKKHVDWQALGFEVIGEAGNGAQALGLIERHRPDLVLCDIVMPLMNGIELLRRVREAGIDSRFVMLTCMNEFEYARLALKYDASGYVLKLSMSVEALHETLAGIRSELSARAERQAKQLLYEYQPTYQLVWELLTGLRETDEAARQAARGSLERALPHVALCSVLHGAKPFTVEQFRALRLLRQDRYAVIHAYTVLGLTTFFCWSDRAISFDPEAAAGRGAGGLRIAAVYGPGVDRLRLPEAWSILLHRLDALRSGGQTGIRYADMPAAAGWTVLPHMTEKLERYLQSSKRVDSSTDHEQINAIIRYVQEHYDEPITLESMAKLVMMDKHYVSGLFKQKTGENLIAFLHRVRVEHAKRELRFADLSVSKIGERVGYASDHYFIRVFKRLTSMTPADYRRRYCGQSGSTT